MDGNLQRIWIPPLPQGWEARFDHNQRKYFFINHETKQTQWDDPRYHNPSATAASSLGSNTRQSHSAQSRAGESVAMKDLSPRRTSHNNRGSSHQAESSLSSQANTAVIDKLHREFPRATKELIADLFQLCHDNERETRDQLQDLGFLKDSKSSQNHQSQSQQSRQRSPEPRRQAAKPEPSESQKRQIANQLKSQFSKLEVNVITIALSTCDYDVNATKRLLQAWEQRETVSTSSGPASGTSTSTSARASTSRPTASLEPAGLSNSDDTSPQALRVEAPSGPSPSPLRTVAEPSCAERGSSPSHQPPHLKARQVTKQKGCKAPRKKETVVTSQPSTRHVTPSSHETVAKGPDSSLRKGPDSSLLITDYEPAHGPDRSLRQGPDRGRVSGPMGAQGVDPTLHCGPQSSLLLNCGTSTPRMLVSNI